MLITPRGRRAALADKSGIAVSIPDIIVSTAVRIVVVGGLIAAIGSMLILSTTAKQSSSTSAAFQASSLRFKADSASADFVRGSGTDTVALMTTSAAGKCDIVTWRNVNTGTVASPVLNLVTEKDSVAGPCTLTTAIPAANPASSNTGRSILLSNVSANVLTYKNIAGRVITFDAAGNAILAPGTAPAGTLDEDWNDLRPQRMEMSIGSTSTKNTTYAKNAKLVGFTSVVNYVQAVGAQNYSKPGDVFTPEGVATVRVARSTTVGTDYSGAREGIRVSFKGGQCVDLSGATVPSIVKITWTPTAPAGLSPVVDNYTLPLSGATNYRDMAGVQNGASGTVTVDAACTAAATPATGSRAYSQPIPNTILTVNQNASQAEKHDLSWSAVSSLPSSFRVEWSSLNNQLLANPVAATTADLTLTTTQVNGTVYGFDTWYSVYPTVSAVAPTSDPSAVKINNAWPAAPGVTNIAYRNTGAGGRVIAGALDWTNSSSCPAGTDRYSRKVDNLRGLSNGTGEWSEFNVGAFQKNITTHTWAPWYALEGYVYASRIDTECMSPITSSKSPITTVQADNWVTPMAQPAAPVWDGYNFAHVTLPRGGTAGYSTCRNHGGNLCGTYADGMKLDYKKTCSPGSWLTYSYVKSTAWNGKTFANSFDAFDGWELPDGVNAANVVYDNAQYNCGTPWATSPTSVVANGFTWTAVRY